MDEHPLSANTEVITVANIRILAPQRCGSDRGSMARVGEGLESVEIRTG
jgi:hypothetical protein